MDKRTGKGLFINVLMLILDFSDTPVVTQLVTEKFTVKLVQYDEQFLLPLR